VAAASGEIEARFAVMASPEEVYYGEFLHIWNSRGYIFWDLRFHKLENLRFGCRYFAIVKLFFGFENF
jgi:hypothetical protein